MAKKICEDEHNRLFLPSALVVHAGRALTLDARC